MKPFDHIDAKTVDEAASLLKNNKAKLIAGGTDLLGILKDRPLRERMILDLKEMRGKITGGASERAAKAIKSIIRP